MCGRFHRGREESLPAARAPDKPRPPAGKPRPHTDKPRPLTLLRLYQDEDERRPQDGDLTVGASE